MIPKSGYRFSGKIMLKLNRRTAWHFVMPGCCVESAAGVRAAEKRKETSVSANPE
jgi:hypothetical protein